MEDKVLGIVKVEVERMLELLEINPTVTYGTQKSDEGTLLISVNIMGDDLGFMIGNRGAHMLSTQYILSNIVRNKVREIDPELKVSVLLDIGGYRQSRADKIEQLALQKADDARILGDFVDLMPMNSADRRVVHATLAKFDDVKTESFGEGRDRYVRITPLKDEEIGVSSKNDEDLEDSAE